ncbi:MAG: HAMP domain-containing histidine kinase [Proteobacteria bacterium]|nr:HAMP domain-containing histidine kinase [Pseudomonadota bacterium]MBS0572774.1 HAMP domain-containing histidine kinase [Pseudomonadota bacterium]
MVRVDLFRRTSFRAAFWLAVLFLTALAIAAGVGYRMARHQLAGIQDARVLEEFDALSVTAQGNDEQDMVEAVQVRIRASRDGSSLFLLRGSDGRVLAANMTGVTLPDGWTTRGAAALGARTDYSYRLFTGPVAGLRLTVGEAASDQSELGEALGTAYAWTALAALVAVVGASAIFAAGVQRRISAVEAALDRVAGGDLAARIPLSGRADDLDRIAAAVNRSLERLAAQVDALRQVSDDIAHDLRTPLNRLRIRIETAARRASEGRDPLPELETALQDSDAIAATFSALLRIAQIEGGARVQTFTDLRGGDLLAAIGDAYAEVAADAGMTLAIDDGPDPAIRGDRGLLLQALANLVENALRHCPPGTAITLGAGRSGARAVLFVQDNGPGIPEGERDKVFRRLYRLEKSRTTDGSGLGLALVKAVAQLHGAEVRALDARPGTRVEITFAAPAA